MHELAQYLLDYPIIAWINHKSRELEDMEPLLMVAVLN